MANQTIKDTNNANHSALPTAIGNPSTIGNPKNTRAIMRAIVSEIAPDLATDNFKKIKQTNKLTIGNKDRIVIMLMALLCVIEI